MRKLLVLFAIALMPAFAGRAHAQGIVFSKGSFAEILAKAKQQNKMVFVDFYTDWCGPCKHMSENVFTLDKVGQLFNEKFVNYKIDAEKGEGPELSEKYGVTGYPTMFFLDGEGKVIHRMVGARDEDKFLEEAKGLEQASKYGGMEQMKEDFAAGRKDSDIAFLKDFYKFLPERDPLRSEVASRYLLNVPEEVFMSETDADIMYNDKMIEVQSGYDKRVFGRVLDMLEKKRIADDGYSANYNIGVVFAVELRIGDIMQQAIDTGNSELLEECIAYQQDFRKRAGRSLTGDGDGNITTGRRLFFASPEFLRLRMMSVNESDPQRFMAEIVPFMDRLIAEQPADSVREKNAPAVLREEPQMAFFYTNDARGSNMTIDYVTDWAKYYWRLAPNNKKVKDQVAQWLNYAAVLNPFNPRGVLSTVPLLVKVGHSKDAVRNLEETLELYRIIDFPNKKAVRQLENTITDIKNDKI